MRPVRMTGLIASLLAWAAFLLPWEHCPCECTDQVVSALDHAHCHDGACPDHHHEDDAGDHEHEHDTVVYVSLRPVKVIMPVDLPVSQRWDAVPPATVAATGPAAEAPSRPPALGLSVVQLL